MTLREQQRWFAGAVMDDARSQEAAGHLTRGPKLDARERLAIYQRAYRARLVECLADDYPVLKNALGDEAFEKLATAYVARFPSVAPNLNAYGRHMPGFCEGFAADLAALEWAIVEVIHAPGEAPLTLEGLGSVPMEKWVEARLRPNSALRLLRFAYPVNAYFQADREGARPTIPPPDPSATAVYRSALTVWRMALSPPMAALLSALVAGKALGEALAQVDDDESPDHVMAWFRHWVSSGLFVGVDLGSPST
ncbi:MAG TPA: DNA-binding domain-containing protein [Polyangiaceae bacterium]